MVRLALAILLGSLALLALAGAQAQTYPVTSQAGTIAIEVHPESTMASLVVSSWASPTEMLDPPSPSTGWGACYQGNVSFACLCPPGPSTCPAGLGPTPLVVPTPNSLRTVHSVGDLVVIHDWSPAGPGPGFQDAVRTDITVANKGTQWIQAVQYRRGHVLRFDEPQPDPRFGYAIMSIVPGNATQALSYLTVSTDLGGASPWPGDPTWKMPGGAPACQEHILGPGSVSGGIWFHHVGQGWRPGCRPGGLVELDLGALAPGTHRTFTMWQGSAANESDANSFAAFHLDADFWFLAQHWNDTHVGHPGTFYWAFGALSAPSANGLLGGGPGSGSGNQTGSSSGNQGPSGNHASSCLGGPCHTGPDCHGCTRVRENQAPHVEIEAPAFAAPGEEVVLVDAGQDADGIVVSWHWEFGDGATAEGRAVRHTYSQPGVYILRLTVQDDQGLSSTKQRTILVQVPWAGPADVLAASPAPAPPTIGKSLAGNPPRCELSDGCGTAPRHALPVPDARLQAKVGEVQESLPLPALIAVLGLSGLLAVASQRRRWTPFAALLFSRLKGNDLLSHPARARLVALVEAEPGLHATELARRTGQSRGSTLHHVRTLVKAGLLKESNHGGVPRYHPATAQASSPPLGEAASRVLAGVESTPGVSLGKLGKASGLPYGAVHYHVRQLAQAGRVEVRKEGLLRVYPVAGDGEKQPAAPHGPSRVPRPAERDAATA